ncbi:MAG: hypothetical protein GY715_05530, partial [Planctomycetes bacterium]|nr:hypothetical protein [Planctomycetota bacterium]
MRTSGGEPFYEHLRSSLQALRAALIELLATVDADPTKPQDLSRRFGLNKNLTWKISKIAGGPDLYASVPHIPGPAGLGIFFRALADAGAPAPLLDAGRRAAAEFDRVVKVHTGDRATLEIMVSDRMPSSVRIEQDEQSRRRAFQANSGIWGVRARTQLSLCMLAPNADDPEMADLVQVNGLDQFHRLRPEARWLLFRRERWSDDGPHPAPESVESLDPDYPVKGGVPLLGDFCSKPIPEIDLIVGEGEEQYELPAGPVGNTAALTCIFGHVTRRVGPAFAEGNGEHSELGCNLITPAEHLVLDMLVHRDFEWAMRPDLLVYGRLDGGAMHALARRQRNVLPVADGLHDLGWGVSAVATSTLPFYSKLVRYVFDSVDWNPDDFRTF